MDMDRTDRDLDFEDDANDAELDDERDYVADSEPAYAALIFPAR